LKRKGVAVKYYHIDSNFDPVNLKVAGDTDAVLFVNYYGIMSSECMKRRSRGVTNIIYDNSQAFFASPAENAMNVYSARKFIGVPDGAYVIGKGIEQGVEEYNQGYSSDSSLFLLQRIEYGSEGKTYKARMANEHRIDVEDICQMSALTHYILDGTDYSFIQQKRRENFMFAAESFKDINKIDPLKFYDETCVPMVYPLVVEDDNLLHHLLAAKHFQGHWWSYLLDELPAESFEYWLSRYIIPITIDQRYGKNEIEHIYKLIKKLVQL
jgi:hypothetical protein